MSTLQIISICIVVMQFHNITENKNSFLLKTLLDNRSLTIRRLFRKQYRLFDCAAVDYRTDTISLLRVDNRPSIVVTKNTKTRNGEFDNMARR